MSAISGPMPLGAPIDTAIGNAHAGAPAGWCWRGEGPMGAGSAVLAVRILPEVAQLARGHDLKVLLRQLFLRPLALLLVRLDRPAAADGVDLNSCRHRRWGQHVAVPGTEEH